MRDEVWHDVLAGLAARANFGELAEIARRVLPAGEAELVKGLCDVGQRLLSLDAEDFTVLADTPGLPASVQRTLRAAAWPVRQPDGEHTALNDLRPTYKLLLELVEVFLVREEYEHVLAVLHLGAEYLPLLAWQAATGDAGHPRMIHKRYGARQAGWRGDDGCALSQQQRQHLPAVFWIAHHPEPAPWRNYLLDQHSKIADVVATCGGAPVLEAVTSSRICTTPCVVVTRLPREKREGLAWGMELSRRFRSSAVLEMRHRSPVGHFFSVPQAEELQRAWSRTWDKLMHDAPSAPAACNPLAEVPKTGSLPGLAALFSAVSPTPLTASHVIGTLTDAIVRSINMGTQ